MYYFLSSDEKTGETPWDDEDDLFLELDSDLNSDVVDSIAEPLYSLLAEMFELQGGNPVNWLRRTLIMFVQISFGKTINRWVPCALHDTAGRNSFPCVREK